MPSGMNRRELLQHGLGAAGLLCAGRLPGALAGEPARPDRSQEAPTSPVAIQRCRSYEPQALRRKLDEALDQIGGIGKLVGGKTVTIKLNLTGGPDRKLGGLPAYRTYHVHPNMVAALCAALHDAGARRIVIVESQYSLKSPEEVLAGGGWDIAAIHAAGGHKVTFEDTRNRGRWPRYSRLAVPWGGFVFPAFDVNQCYEKTDVFISLGKMKDHANAGVTLAVKNLFGIAPTSLYGADAPNEDTTSARAPFHKGTKKVPDGVPGELDHGLPNHWSCRVPRITADLFGIRPVDLAVIDGVETNRGGEGWWIKGAEPIQPGLFLVGRNAVSTDAVGAAAMGYDPQADHREFPFPGENHLKLLASVGVGTIDLERIDVRGLPLAEAIHPFNPKRLTVGQPIFQ
ncbi:MAG: DUF362 domain-containing protein [Planctomycetes bacterium]|nr:DUF362 domain-containing protein [Planctomycetota bacterium]